MRTLDVERLAAGDYNLIKPLLVELHLGEQVHYSDHPQLTRGEIERHLTKVPAAFRGENVIFAVRDEIGQALDVIQQLKAINVACLEVLKKARTAGDDVTLLRSVDRIHRQIELQARLLGEIEDAPRVNVLVLPEWHRLRVVVVEALRPFPEARAVVVQALRDAGA